MSNKVDIFTSYGSFSVTYGDYHVGWGGSLEEPPEDETVEIIDVEFIDDPEEYGGTIEELMQTLQFMTEVENEVIQAIKDDMDCDDFNDYEGPW